MEKVNALLNNVLINMPAILLMPEDDGGSNVDGVLL